MQPRSFAFQCLSAQCMWMTISWAKENDHPLRSNFKVESAACLEITRRTYHSIALFATCLLISKVCTQGLCCHSMLWDIPCILRGWNPFAVVENCHSVPSCSNLSRYTCGESFMQIAQKTGLYCCLCRGFRNGMIWKGNCRCHGTFRIQCFLHRITEIQKQILDSKAGLCKPCSFAPRGICRSGDAGALMGSAECLHSNVNVGWKLIGKNTYIQYIIYTRDIDLLEESCPVQLLHIHSPEDCEFCHAPSHRAPLRRPSKKVGTKKSFKFFPLWMLWSIFKFLFGYLEMFWVVFQLFFQGHGLSQKACDV